jgi:cbb3-type cytochrome oxidase subunit 3
MKLSDIVGHWDLATYPKIALIIFLLVFIGVLFRIYFRSGGRNLQRYASMAIDEDTPRTDPNDRAE